MLTSQQVGIIDQFIIGITIMRRKYDPQLSIFSNMGRNKIAKELQKISEVFDATPKVLDMAYQDLLRSARPTTGREGMTAE